MSDKWVITANVPLSNDTFYLTGTMPTYPSKLIRRDTFWSLNLRDARVFTDHDAALEVQQQSIRAFQVGVTVSVVDYDYAIRVDDSPEAAYERAMGIL